MFRCFLYWSSSQQKLRVFVVIFLSVLLSVSGHFMYKAHNPYMYNNWVLVYHCLHKPHLVMVVNYYRPCRFVSFCMSLQLLGNFSERRTLCFRLFWLNYSGYLVRRKCSLYRNRNVKIVKDKRSCIYVVEISLWEVLKFVITLYSRHWCFVVWKVKQINFDHILCFSMTFLPTLLHYFKPHLPRFYLVCYSRTFFRNIFFALVAKRPWSYFFSFFFFVFSLFFQNPIFLFT